MPDNKFRLRHIFVSLLLLISSSTISLAQEEWSVEALMRTLAAVNEAELSFVEQRSSVFLIGAIELKGDIFYRAPDLIRKTIAQPYEEVIEIKGDKITITKTSKRGEPIVQRHSLASSKALNVTVSGIRGTLSGNMDSLLEHYDVTLDGDMQSWLVMLIPKEDIIRQRIERIAISGSGDQINVIDTYDSDGDETKLLLSYLSVK